MKDMADEMLTQEDKKELLKEIHDLHDNLNVEFAKLKKSLERDFRWTIILGILTYVALLLYLFKDSNP